MKALKKSVCLLLVICLLGALAIAAFAADTPYAITVKNENEAISIKGCFIEAYKLFDVTYSDRSGDGSNDAYAYTIDMFNPFYYRVAARAIVEKYFTLTPTQDDTVFQVTPKNDFDVRAFADEIYSEATKITPTKKASTYLDETVVIDNLPSDGYYIVLASDKLNTWQHIHSAVALTTAEPTATVSVKADAPFISKTVGDNKKVESYTSGDSIPFTLTSAVPVTTGYSTYKYTIHDTMSDGLDFEPDSLIVTVGENELVQNVDYTLNTSCSDNCTFEVQFDDLLVKDNAVRKYKDGDAITVTYSAKLNNRFRAKEREVNSVFVEYSNHPYDTNETYTTPVDKVYIYSFGIQVDKYASDIDAGLITDDIPVLVPGQEYALVSSSSLNPNDCRILWRGDGSISMRSFNDIPTDKNGDLTYARFFGAIGTFDENNHLFFSNGMLAQYLNANRFLHESDKTDLYIVPLNTIEPIRDSTVGIRLTAEPIIHISSLDDLDYTYTSSPYTFSYDLSDYTSYTVPGTGNDGHKRLGDAWFTLLNNEGKFYCYTPDGIQWVDDYDPLCLLPPTSMDGKTSIFGLEEGTYYLREMKAPDGYNKLTEDIRIDITATYDDFGNIQTSSTKLVPWNSPPVGKPDVVYAYTIGVENKSGTVLPSTGGIGTTIFYITGSVLVAGALIFLITKKRMSKKKDISFDLDE